MVNRAAVKRLLVALTLTFSSFAALTTAVTVPAGAAVGCYGHYCSGKDPATTGCANDAVTVSAKDFRGGRLELRWSRTCQTEWARLQIYPGGFAYTLSAVQDTGYTQSKQWAAGVGQGTYWTNQIYSPVRKVQARATGSCFGLFDCATGGQTTGWW